MPWNTIPTEQTTAATDLLLALVALFAAPWAARRAPFWGVAFAGLGGGALLGALAHGLRLPPGLHRSVWALLYLSLASGVAALGLAALEANHGSAVRRRATPAVAALGLGAWAVLVFGPGAFALFAAYEALVLTAALALYGAAARRGQPARRTWRPAWRSAWSPPRYRLGARCACT